MSAIVNARDLILEAVSPRVTSSPSAPRLVLLAADANFFHVGGDNTATPQVINLVATAVGINGSVSFSTSPPVPLGGAGLHRTLAYLDFGAGPVTVTASITDNGTTYQASQTINKVKDGSAGLSGATAGVAYLYQYSTVPPAKPIGQSLFDWLQLLNTSYAGSDGWSATVPANPGGPLVRLWVAQKGISAPAGTVSSTVLYADADIVAYAQNGIPGIKAAKALAYQWAASAPTVTGSSIFTWAAGTYDATPQTGWTKAKGDPPGPGYTLYEASIDLVDTAGAATSAINWTGAGVNALAYSGSAGASAALAYTLVDGNSLAQTPTYIQVNGAALPPTGTWGETRAWQSTPPTPAAGQSVFQSDGIYSPTTGKTNWNVPYQSSLKVGSLSAISTHTGTLIVDGTLSTANSRFSVNANGDVDAYGMIIRAADGTVILSSGSALHPSYAAPGTLNSGLSIGSNGVLYGGGGGQVTIPGLDNSVLRAGNPITQGNITTYMQNASIGGVQIQNNTIYAENIISRAATSLDYTKRTSQNGVQTVLPIYMDHYGILVVDIGAQFDWSGDLATASFRLEASIDGINSDAVATSGFGLATLALSLGSQGLGPGTFTMRITVTTNYPNGPGNHSIAVKTYKSYR